MAKNPGWITVLLFMKIRLKKIISFPAYAAISPSKLRMTHKHKAFETPREYNVLPIMEFLASAYLMHL